jgi:sugar phosphate isomerase/epimerase
MQQPFLVTTSRASGSNFLEAVEFAKAHAFDGIDWNLDVFRLPVASPLRAKFFGAARESGLGSRFHAPCQDTEIAHADPLISGVALHYLKLHVELIRELGPGFLTIHIGSRSIPVEELSWEKAVANLSELVAYGKDRGVTVCLENLKKGWTSDPRQWRELLDLTGAAATFDVGHAHASPVVASGELSLVDFLDAAGDRVKNAHVYQIETPDGYHQPPSDLVQLAPVLDRLLQHGCTWWLLELKSYQEILATRDLIRTSL